MVAHLSADVLAHLGGIPLDRIRAVPPPGTATEEDSRRTRASWGWRDVFGSAFILVCILGAYLYFRG